MKANPLRRVWLQPLEHRGLSGCWLFVALWLLAWAAGCASPSRATPSPVPQPLPTSSLEPASTPTAVVTATHGALTLTWWTPEFISPSAAQPSGPLLEQYLADFEAVQEGRVRVLPVLKARYGKGGLLDFLRTAQPVAPGILPDIVSLDVSELEQAAALNLLRPLEPVMDSQLIERLYPFAQQAGRFGDHLLALQYLADLEHVVYNHTQVTTPPSTWADVLDNRISYLFPAGSPQPPFATSAAERLPDGFISFYLSAGGTIDPQSRNLLLQADALTHVFTFYHDAQRAGLLPTNIGKVASLEETWNAYAEGMVPLVHVSARRYLANRQTLSDTGFAAVPGWGQPSPPVMQGWALAIVTPDPVRQSLAAEFIAWLLDSERAGEWTRSAGWLPTAPSALAVWGADPYYEFLDRQLASGVLPPGGPDHAQVAARLQKAALSVLEGEATPAEATQAVLNTAR